MRIIHALTSSAAALFAGVFQALSMADPWNGQPHGWLQVLSLAALIALLTRHAARNADGLSGAWVARPAWRRGLLLGWLFGLGWMAATFWWLFISMHTYGGLPAALAVAAVLALAGLLALFYAAACAVFAALVPARLLARRPVLSLLAFAALWTLAELARGRWFTGFPWGAGGYAHVDGVLSFLPRYVGVYGVGFVAAALAALLVFGRQVRWRSARAVAGVAALLVLGAGLWAWRFCDVHLCHTPPAGTPRLVMDVALLQGNIPQDQKFVPGTGVADSLRWYGEQLRDARATLVVAPETALPLLPRDLPEGYWQALVDRFGEGGQAALMGVPLGDMAAGYTNSVVGFAPALAQPYRYDKHHLVPFGEFIPPLFKWFTRMMNIPLGDFDRGGLNQAPLTWQGQRLAPNICYEDLFGEELAARFADPARAPTAFVNVSNIGWFGDSVAIDQHLAISRMRALEFERPMLRATNTGATAIINHRAEVTHQLPRMTRGVLLGQFEGRTQITPFARWAAYWSLWPLWGFCMGLVVLVWTVRRRVRPRLI